MNTHPFEHIVTPDGETRILNLVPSPADRLVMVGAPGLTLPDSEIKDFDAWPAPIAIKDQNGKGACNGHATATALEFARYQGGQPHVPLSAWFVYGRLTGGWDRGSNILEAFDLIQKEGCAPESLVEYKDFSGKYSADVSKAATRFRLEIGDKLET